MKMYRRVRPHDNESDVRFEEKLALGSKSDMRNLVNFDGRSGKSENVHFDVVLLFLIAYIVSASKVPKSCLSWQWKKIQTLIKNPLFVWKTTWGVSWTSTRALKRLKICMLIAYFCRKYVMFELKKYRGFVS